MTNTDPQSEAEAVRFLLSNAGSDPDWEKNHADILAKFNIDPERIKGTQVSQLNEKIRRVSAKIDRLRAVNSGSDQAFNPNAGEVNTALELVSKHLHDGTLSQLKFGPQEPPEEYRVENIRGEVPDQGLFDTLCGLFYFKRFNRKLVPPTVRLHPDFTQGPSAKSASSQSSTSQASSDKDASMTLFYVVSVLVSIFLVSPLFLMGYFFPDGIRYTMLGVCILLLLWGLLVAGKIQTDWRRYASWVYSVAEPREALAYFSGMYNRGLSLRLRYPNGYEESLKLQQSISSQLLAKLKEATPVTVRRDSPTKGAVVILDLDGARIWCVPE